MENVNTKQIVALREAADWLEKHPELPEIYMGNIGVFHRDVANQRSEAAMVARAMGHVDKFWGDNSIHLLKRFGKEATIAYLADRDQVCERVQVGTRVEPAYTIPAREEQHEPEHEVPLYEWRCDPILADEKSTA